MRTVSLAQALALRRAMVVVAALAATLLAHAAAMGGLELTAWAPATWGWLALTAMVCGPRTGRWRPRGTAGMLASLLAGQAVLHVGMWAAPWAFGIATHHPEPLLTPLAAIAHAGAALALALLVARGEDLLGAALRAARRVRRLLGRRFVYLEPAPARALVPWTDRTLPAAPIRTVACRGPPALT